MTSIEEILKSVQSKLTEEELLVVRQNILQYAASALMDSSVAEEVWYELTPIK